MEDKIHPDHYKCGNLECIDVMFMIFGKWAVIWFCLLNVFKYLWRCDLKNGEEDVQKAVTYFRKFKEYLQK